MFSTSTQKPLRVFVESSWRSTSTNIWLQVKDSVLLHNQNLFCSIHTPAKDMGSCVGSSICSFPSVKMANSILVFSTLQCGESFHSRFASFRKYLLYPAVLWQMCCMTVHSSQFIPELACLSQGTGCYSAVPEMEDPFLNELRIAGCWDGGMQEDRDVAVAKSCF